MPPAAVILSGDHVGFCDQSDQFPAVIDHRKAAHLGAHKAVDQSLNGVSDPTETTSVVMISLIFTTHHLPTHDLPSISPTDRPRPRAESSQDGSIGVQWAFWARWSFGSSKPGDCQHEKQDGEDADEPDL